MIHHHRPAILLSLALLLFISACSQQPTPELVPAATPIPAIEINPVSGDVKASADIVPAQKAELGFPVSGRIKRLAIDVGDHVKAGSVLMELNDAAAQAAVAQAQAALLRTQAQLAELQAGPRQQEIAVVQARLDGAEAHLTQVTEGARAEEIVAAQAALSAAKAAQQQLFSGPTEQDRIAAEAALSNAEAARNQAQTAYDRVAWHSDIALKPESQKLQEATNNYEAAKARYDALFSKPDAAAVAAARAQVQQAQADLDRLQASATAGQLAEAEAQVRSAQAELDLLKAGVRDESIAVAEAAVAEAEAALIRAEAGLATTILLAPTAGIISSLDVNPGEMVLSGQTVLTLADLDRLQVETTDLSERDVGRVAIGQPVVVFVKALNTDIPGRVLSIAPQATIIGGDVVYAVVIELDEHPPGLRWGMSADVDILAE
ncbi:MAG: HlyD family efflux transporter periplasmic adaptor subunit [Chloroflexi bacterium]|nr:HlyD family efflux transporter periplasmic adaptor subunit [Chloroflexota bacterium]